MVLLLGVIGTKHGVSADRRSADGLLGMNLHLRDATERRQAIVACRITGDRETLHAVILCRRRSSSNHHVSGGVEADERIQKYTDIAGEGFIGELVLCSLRPQAHLLHQRMPTVLVHHWMIEPDVRWFARCTSPRN